MATASTCDHHKGLHGARDLFTKRNFNKLPVTQKKDCIICDVLRPFWKKHKDLPSRYPGYDTSKEPKIQNLQETNHYNFVLFQDELGEAYHVLLSCLYLRWHAGPGTGISITSTIYTTRDKGETEIEQLFAWYDIYLVHSKRAVIDKDTKKKLRRGSDARKLATGVITSAFERCRVMSDKKVDGMLLPDQETIFGVFRMMLDHPYGWSADNKDLRVCNVDYFRPSYLAKYWVNRYLRCTQDNKKLPEEGDVTNLAVIHCRLYAASDDGRWMNDTLLKHIAQSIQRTNYRANYTNGARFSHVLLYGDFVEADGRKMKSTLERAFTNARVGEAFDEGTKEGESLRTKDGIIQVMYVSRPWLPRAHGKDGICKEETHQKVRCLWEQFRNPDVDHMRLQVKILAIWTMLCKRYGPKVCVIGHRSGFIEGAALIGIPVFYLNCERPKCHESAGDMLYKPTERKQCTKRLHMLANVMNTLIPIELFYSKRQHVSSSTGPPEKLKKRVSRLQSKAHITLKESKSQKKSVQQGNSEQSGSENRVPKEYKIDNRYDKELMAALFMYMCCSTTPWWVKDRRIPAWTTRVLMMHDSDETPYGIRAILDFLQDENSLGTQLGSVSSALVRYKEHLPTKEEDKKKQIDLFKKEWASTSQQSGREWLRRRFRFANDRGTGSMFTYGWNFQEWSPARRQLPDQPEVDVDESDVFEWGVDESDVDESSVNDTNVDGSGVDESEGL